MCVFNFSLAFGEQRNLLIKEVILLLRYKYSAAGRYLSLACQSFPRATAYIPYWFSLSSTSPFLLFFKQAYPDQDALESQPVWTGLEDHPQTNSRDIGKKGRSHARLENGCSLGPSLPSTAKDSQRGPTFTGGPTGTSSSSQLDGAGDF